MNLKKLIPTMVVVFIVANIFGTLIHAVLLKADYLPIAGYYRQRGEEKMLFISLAYFALRTKQNAKIAKQAREVAKKTLVIPTCNYLQLRRSIMFT